MKSKFVFFLLTFFLFTTSLSSQNADIHWLRCISQTNNPGLDNAMKFTSSSVTPLMVAVPVGLFMYEHYRTDGNVRRSYVVAASLATTGIIAFGLKYSVSRPRPYATYPDIIKKGNGGSKSFPSGHTSFAFSLATSVSLEYPKWYVIAPSYAWACAVGYSRMRLGMHYPSDVFAGAAIGAGCAWACWYLNRKLWRE